MSFDWNKELSSYVEGEVRAPERRSGTSRASGPDVSLELKPRRIFATEKNRLRRLLAIKQGHPKLWYQSACESGHISSLGTTAFSECDLT
jgi:hypothetical protein